MKKLLTKGLAHLFFFKESKYLQLLLLWWIAVYPLVDLFNNNQDQVDRLTFLITLIGYSLILLVPISILYKTHSKKLLQGATLLAIGSFYLFSYQTILNSLTSPYVSGLTNEIFTNLLFTGFILGIGINWRSHQKKILNVITTVSITFGVFFLYQQAVQIIGSKAIINSPRINIPTSKCVSHPPNIYYIVFDGHASIPTLESLYEYDASNFTDALEDLGFIIAQHVASNYPQTYPSLASTLNLNYIDDLVILSDKPASNTKALKTLINKNFVAEYLKTKCYKYVSIASSWSGIDTTNTDYFFSPRFRISEYHQALLSRTPLQFATNNAQYQYHKNTLDFQINTLKADLNTPSPYFVFSHILLPHPPFMFKSNGEFIPQDTRFSFSDGNWKYLDTDYSGQMYRNYYKEQLSYTDQQIIEIVTSILERDHDSLIIIQSDHGPASILDWGKATPKALQERFGIFLAVYGPKKLTEQISNLKSPINLYRKVLNYYFDEDFIELADKHYYPNFADPKRYLQIDDEAVYSK